MIADGRQAENCFPMILSRQHENDPGAAETPRVSIGDSATSGAARPGTATRWVPSTPTRRWQFVIAVFRGTGACGVRVGRASSRITIATAGTPMVIDHLDWLVPGRNRARLDRLRACDGQRGAATSRGRRVLADAGRAYLLEISARAADQARRPAGAAESAPAGRDQPGTWSAP